MKSKVWFLFLGFAHFSYTISSQSSFIEQDTTINNRLLPTSVTLAVGYGTSVALLNNTWYKKFSRSSFHFFDDWGEWENVDKLGHIFASQSQGIYTYHLYRWSGLSENQSILYASMTSLLFQSTIEVLDGFSSEWGFSLSDYTSNLIGVALFAFQQKRWKEQRILLKVSSIKNNYSTVKLQQSVSNGGSSFNFEQRASELFGNGLPSRFLKDYNAQTIWLSVNLQSVLKLSKCPSWINLAFGYGAQNMLGGYENSWNENGQYIQIPNDILPRYSQFYLSPDIDLTKIKVKKKGWKTLLGILNVIKVPFPTIEVTTLGNVKFHLLKF